MALALVAPRVSLTRFSWIRSGVGLVALAALLSAGCGGTDYAQQEAGPGLDAGGDAVVPDGAPDAGGDGQVVTPDSQSPAKVVSCSNTIAAAGAGTCSATKGSGPAVLITAASVLAPDTVYENGQVLFVEQQIACVGCDCASHPQAGDATRLDCKNGVVTPALINLHDHLGFTEGAPPTWTARYDHRNEWRKGLNGKPKIPQPSNVAKKDNIGPLWGELRQVIAGTGSIMGAGGGDGLLRNLDSTKTEGLGGGKIDTPTFPLGDNDGQMLVSTCDYPTIPTLADVQAAQAWVPHVAEGTNEAAHNETLCLDGQRPAPGVDLTTANATFIHAVGLTARDALEMAASGTGVNWSARTNISLYGMTADVVMLKNVGVKISLGTDWTFTGSMNLLRELACAAYLNETRYNHAFSSEELWRMVTANPADQIGHAGRIGRLKVGLVPDIAIFDARGRKHHDAVVQGTVADVALVVRGGKVLYGDAAAVDALAADTAQCEALDVCSAQRKLCLKAEIGLTLAEMKARFVDSNSQPYAPYELFFCGEPKNEPPCVPSRPGEYDGQPTASDGDGDGVADASDTCPKVFNPPRPMNQGKQPDEDGDGVGDECDPCPLDKNTTQCTTKVDPNDSDGDGVSNDKDNCPAVANKDQKDDDQDNLGNACDPCPQAAGTCAFLIKELHDPALGKQPPLGTKVKVEGAVVTAIRTVKSLGFYVRQGKGAYEAFFIYTATQPKTTDTGAVLKEGDVIDLEGTYAVFHGADQLEDLTVIKVVGQGGDASAIPVKTAELQPGSARAKELESHLVRVSAVKVAAKITGDDDFWVADDGNACSGATPPCARVGDFLYDGGANDSKPASAAGQSFSSVTGVVDTYDTQSLAVRTDADFAP